MNKWLSSLIAFLSVTGLQAQQTAETPKLVISIVVDQLREDYLQYFSPTFGEKGFKRLMNGGLAYHRVDFGFPNIGRAASIATIYTGAYPYYHGIVADKKYDFESKREISTVYDNTYIGNYTTDRFSPLALLSSTFGDELKIATEGKSDVYAIAPHAEEAILSAGKYANAAFWLDDYNGKWATTTYYKDIPWYVDRYNTNQVIGNSPEKIWTPALAAYNGFSYTKSALPFKHTFSKNDKDKFLKIKQSPYINTEVTNLAATFFEYADLGKRIYPCVLALTYYAGNYNLSAQPEEFGWEIQDIYYRLDKEIERLLDLAEKKVGLKNVLVVLTSSGYFDSATKLPVGFSPAGEFFPNRCTALLNMYLMAIYGSGNWVTGYYNEQIYLNKKLIENEKIDWNEILRKSADFIAQFSGIQEVTTAGQWLVDDTGRSVEFRRGMNKKISGDLFLELQPGWVIVHEDQINKNNYTRNNSVLSPLYIFGNNIPKENIFRIVKATEIAPTLAFIMRIRPPNASKDAPLQEFIK
ncbi:alkaline phosphatase [Bacteroidia bacterium]|nr:alkaline phosphatase [Bacteroidia bacterium]GHT84664.1 alkaline phosphatase [Bacteroidia bacterium]